MVVWTLICAVNPFNGESGSDTCRAGSKSDYRLLMRAEDLFREEAPCFPRDDPRRERADMRFQQAGIFEEGKASGVAAKAQRDTRALLDSGREQVKQQLREVHSSRLLTSLGFNLKSAWRFARRAPSFSIAIILILAFAVGANSAVFSAMDAVLLRPLPFPDADELILLGQHDVKNRDANRFVAPVRLEDWNRMNSTLQDRLVNVASSVYGKVYFPVRSNGLKSLGRFLWATWSNSEASDRDSHPSSWSGSPTPDRPLVLARKNAHRLR